MEVKDFLSKMETWLWLARIETDSKLASKIKHA
jgi:hypothetical protein